jgi:hypothetical protein
MCIGKLSEKSIPKQSKTVVPQPKQPPWFQNPLHRDQVYFGFKFSTDFWDRSRLFSLSPCPCSSTRYSVIASFVMSASSVIQRCETEREREREGGGREVYIHRERDIERATYTDYIRVCKRMRIRGAGFTLNGWFDSNPLFILACSAVCARQAQLESQDRTRAGGYIRARARARRFSNNRLNN